MDWFTFVWNPTNLRAVLLGVLVFAVCVWCLRTHRCNRKLPPGPRGWPLLGFAPQLAFTKDPIHQAISKLGNRFGPVLSFKLANQLIVVLQDYDVIKDAMDQYQLSGRPALAISQLTMPGQGILTASGEPWLELRRFSSAALRKLGMGKLTFEKQISTEAQHLLREIRRKSTAAFDPRSVLENGVANIICYLVFGRRFDYNDAKFSSLLYTLNQSHELGGAGGVMEFLPIFSKLTFLPIVKKHIAIDLAFIKIMGALLEDHQKGYQPGVSRDYTDAFRNEMKDKESRGVESYMTPASLYYSASGLFGAGTETTTSTLRWALLYMIAYPKIQARVQQEIDGVVGRHRLPKLSDEPDLPYTQAVLCEIQRTSIVPLGVPHKCIEDTTVSGYNIPEGAIIVTNLWHIMHDPAEWTDPEAFQPERFLDNGRFIRREKFIPFGLGRRFCLGERLAKMELFIVFTHLLHQFTFRVPEGTRVSFNTIDVITHAPAAYEVTAIPRQ